ncbi:Extracellular signal-regulated kinase 2 [Bienertia sinuspersici]
MEDQITNSELTISRNCNFTEKAWHLASILIRLRRPASVIELVERCSLFETSPEFVEFLCSIPNSPIYLTADDFVVLSMLVFSAFGELFTNSMPKFELQVYGGERMLRTGEGFMRTYIRKRKKLGNEMMPIAKRRAVLTTVDENERETVNLSACQRIVSPCLEGFNLPLNAQSHDRFLKAVNLQNISDIVGTPSIVNSSIGLLNYLLDIDEDLEMRHKQNTFGVNDMDKLVTEGSPDELYADGLFLDLTNNHGEISTALLQEKMAELSALLEGRDNLVSRVDTDGHEKMAELSALLEGRDNLVSRVDTDGHEKMAELSALLEGRDNLVSRVDTDGPLIPLCVELNQHGEKLPVESTVKKTPNSLCNSQIQETKVECMSDQPLMDCAGPEERVGSLFSDSCIKGVSPVDKLRQTNTESPIDSTLPLNTELTKIKPISQPLVYADPHSSAPKSRKKSTELKNVPEGELTQKQQTPSKLIENNTVDIIHKEQKGKHQKAIIPRGKSKHISRNNASIQEKCDNAHKPSKDQQKLRFPEFEAFTVEQEEGSGGYGTVYKARRKTDGSTFAIKCPHVNAQKQHVKNESKMLERFGGKNYVIKLECFLKSENSDCLVLQHVEHDRPEVLKKEIDISQLQWYGYCMFKALVGLHKQGVFHRDIKPGNFLFSSKTLTGYLIDFNLAKDMNQKHGKIEKLQPKGGTAIQPIPSLHFKSTSPSKRKKNQGVKFSPIEEAAISGSKYALESKTPKKKVLDKVKAYEDLGRCNSLTSQGADGSGITSTKDMTSTRTPSAERYRDRQPLPCKGRKALLNLAKEAMQNPNLGELKAPASNRKRVAASPGISNRKHIYPTPTPLHSSGIAISGAGPLNNRGMLLDNCQFAGFSGLLLHLMCVLYVHRRCQAN